MDLFWDVVKFLITFYLISTVVNIFYQARRNAKEREAELQKIILEKEKAGKIEKIEMVIDEICGNKILKSKAFIIDKDNKRHYFCSWDCRERFLAKSELL